MIGIQMIPDSPEQSDRQTPVSANKAQKYVFYSLGGLVLILGLTFGMGQLLKPDNNQAETKRSFNKSFLNLTNNQNSQSIENRLINKSDIPTELNQSTYAADLTAEEVDEIMAGLSFLDYQPEGDELGEDFLMKSFKDSLARADWFDAENNKLNQRRFELKNWEKEITARELMIDKKAEQLSEAQAQKLLKLAKLYDSMDAKAVAELMNSLDNNTVAQTIQKMKIKNGAQVLMLMSSERAAVISEKILRVASN